VIVKASAAIETDGGRDQRKRNGGIVKRIYIAVCIVLSLTGIACDDAWAQATAQISGSVQDASGAVLPGVEITATQIETGVSRMTVTNETGLYVLPNLPLGPYRLEATLPGFRTFVQTGVVLQVGSNPTLNVVLQVGQVSEQVEVQANAALVETRSLSVGQVMETTRIMELPLNGRNAQELVLLQGGASQVTTNAGGYTFGANRLTISTAGSLGTAMEYTLDGIRHIDPYDGLGLVLPFPDALAEFKTEIGGMSAQQGRGSQVSAVTKSGTNDFHGSLFEFVRNDLFNSRNFYATKGSTLKRNQFGGTIGGRIIRNKLFFFAGYQGTTLRQDPSDTQAWVPTAAMLAGDFTAFASAACNSRGAVTLRDPFVNNRINPALFSPAALKLSAILPKTTDPCGKIIYGTKLINDGQQFVTKIDNQMSDRHSLFGRFMISTNDDTSPVTGGNVLSGVGDTYEKSYAFTAGSTYLLSPSTVNAFRLSFTRNTHLTSPTETTDANSLGIKVYEAVPKVLTLTITSGFMMGSNFRRMGTNLYQFADDVSMTRGPHQFGFGGRVGQSRTNVVTGSTIFPAFNVSGSVTGLGLADFLTGKLSNFVQGAGSGAFNRMNYVSLYLQDTWQLRPRLTMSYGLRWSPVLPLVDYRRPVPVVSNFSMDRYRQGLRSTVFVNAPPGFSYPGDPEFVQSNNGASAEKPQADVWNPYWGQFAPRFGFAWDIEGNGRTSLRASYGLNYEEYSALYNIGTRGQQPPWGSTTRLVSPAGGFDDPWLGIPGGNPFPLSPSRNMPFVVRGDYLPNNPDLTPTYTQMWNLSLQKEVGSGTLMTASYLGTQIVHLQSATPLNSAVYIAGVGDASGRCFLNGQVTPFTVAPGAACSTTGNTQDRRVLSLTNYAQRNEIGRLAVIVNGGTQSYNGMLLSLQNRSIKGLNFNTNYTWAHCIGDYMGRSNAGYGSSVDHTYQDPNDRARDRANCEVDQRHVLNLTGVAEMPQFANGTANMLASGWRLSGIYRRSTGGQTSDANLSAGGRTVTLGAAAAGQRDNVGGGDVCLCDISNQRPDLILPDAVYLDKSGRPDTQYLNPAAFRDPAPGTLGNMGRVNIQMPPAWQFDMSLARTFRFLETQSLEFRAEAYNVLNSFRPGRIDTALTSAQFGKIRTAQDPRIFQFALKYLF
jgi:hypothetical protein